MHPQLIVGPGPKIKSHVYPCGQANALEQVNVPLGVACKLQAVSLPQASPSPVLMQTQ